MSNNPDRAIPIEGWPMTRPVQEWTPKWIGPARIVKTRSETTPFTVEEYFNGDLFVCDDNLISVARFDAAYREFAEEMRDRLNIRHLAQQGEGS